MINDEALDVVQNLINENKKLISVYTNIDIYHLEKIGNGRYELTFESGEDFCPDDYGYIIQSVQQLKQFFKSYERISIIETDDFLWDKYRNLERVHRDINNYNIEGVPNFNETECSICLDTLLPGKVNNRQRLQCGHTYHKKCILQNRDHKCPMCRGVIEKVYNLKFGNLKFGNLKFGNLKFGNLKFGNLKFGNGKRIRGGGRKKKVIPLPSPPLAPSPNSSKQEKQTFIKNLKFYIKKYRYMLSATTLIALLALIVKLKNNKSLPEESLPQLQEPLPQLQELLPLQEPLPEQENNNDNLYRKDYIEILFEFSTINER
jgi:hypothetical protein